MSAAALFTLNCILALMMFGIALSLQASDFVGVMKAPKGPLVGLMAQFLALPALTCLLTLWLPLPAEIALGLILVSCCPGGSFSNIMTYLGGGNTAMSVSMTGIASLAAAFMTPFNFVLYSSLNPVTREMLTQIDVPTSQLFGIVVLVLAIPLALGLLCRRQFPGFAQAVEPLFRFGSLLTLFGFVAIALYQNWQQFAAAVSIFVVAVVLHNLLALSIGWVSAFALRLPVPDRRAITLEVGLQNSGLGLGIIFTFFAEQTDMALIAATWGIWHLISGLSLTLIWQRLDKKSSLSPTSTKQADCL